VPKFYRKKNDPFSSDQRREIWNRVGDPDPQDPHVFGLPDPDPLVRGMDPDPEPSLFS
jgi:hypothetical protein